MGIPLLPVARSLFLFNLANKIVVVNRGRIQQIGEPQKIYSQPAKFPLY
jgi:ABC-type sugar transport system ATPase subunit